MAQSLKMRLGLKGRKMQKSRKSHNKTAARLKQNNEVLKRLEQK